MGWLRRLCSRKVLVSVLQLLLLPLCAFGTWGIFGTGLIQTLTKAVDGRPLLEFALFSTLSLLPYVMARFRLVAGGLSVVIEQSSYLLARFRNRYSVAAHLVFHLKAPLVRTTQIMLYFAALNLFVNSVPDSLEMPVPRLLRFLDTNGDGTLEALEIEEWVYKVSTRFLSAGIFMHFVLFLISAKRPPEGWDLEHSRRRARESGKISATEQYWQLTSSRAGWWTLLDRVITGLLWLAIAWSWLLALGIDSRTVVAAGGAGGLALGLAAQQVVGNGVAALILLATSPCKVGDLVEVGTLDLRYKGRVTEIGWNSTAITTEDGNLVYVPNGTILETPLKVITSAASGQDGAPAKVAHHAESTVTRTVKNNRKAASVRMMLARQKRGF